MAESSSNGMGNGLGDLLTLLLAANPVGTITKTVSQFQRGIDDLLRSVSQFQTTIEQFNGIAMRVNVLLDDIEPPIKALMPQVTRTINAADTLVTQLTAPIERVAPALSRLADTLDASALDRLPRDLGAVVELLGDVARRLQPLGQLAESAGGMFSRRGLGALFGSAQSSDTEAAAPAPAAAEAPRSSAASPKPAQRSGTAGNATARTTGTTRTTGRATSGKTAAATSATGTTAGRKSAGTKATSAKTSGAKGSASKAAAPAGTSGRRITTAS